jgi:L-threonylcarbamoyladenylate synthase
VRILRVDGAAPDPDVVREAAETLLEGGLLVYPTDTLYALGAVALDGAAVARLRMAKGREAGKALPVVAADAAQASALWAGFPPGARALSDRFWPGPLTIVLDAAPSVPTEVTAGRGTLAIRVPALEVTRQLARAAGALVATSANLAGGAPPSTCADALAAVGGAAALAIDAGPGGRLPSTLVDLTRHPPQLLRSGAVPWEDVAAVLRSVPS